MKGLRHCTITFAALALSACASLPDNLVSSPQVNLDGVRVLGLGFKSQSFLLSFSVHNPNSFPLPINSVNYGLRLDGQRFASGETIGDFTIPANGDSEFAITVDLDLLTTAPQVLSIVRDGTRDSISYQVEGRFGIDLPTTPTVRYRNTGTVRLNSDTAIASFLSN